MTSPASPSRDIPRPDGGRREPAALREVLRDELRYLKHHRHQKREMPDMERSLVGLALSGGGIRSATTCLGALQALARMHVLPMVDYLSTVSGGGYIGACLSSLLSWNGRAGTNHEDRESPYRFATGETPRFGTQPDSFPFRLDYRREWSRVGRDVVAHLRTHGNFLIARMGLLRKEALRGVGTLLTGIVFSLVTFLLVLLTGSLLYVGATLALAPELACSLSVGRTAQPRVELNRVATAGPAPVRGACAPAAARDPAQSLWGAVAGNVEATLKAFRIGPAAIRGRAFAAQVLGAAAAVGALLALVVVLWMLWRLRAYLRGAGPKVLQTKRGDSIEDVFERSVLQGLAWCALTAAVVTTVVLRVWGPWRFSGYRQVVWLLVPVTVLLSLRVVGVALGVVVLPRRRLWTRRMRSIWGAFQGIAIYVSWLLGLLAVAPFAVFAIRDHTFSLGLGTALALVSSRLLTIRSVASGGRRFVVPGGLRRPLLAIVVTLALVLGWLFFSALVVTPELVSHGWARPMLHAAAALALFTIIGFWVDFNKLSPHYFYRDRLAETYLLSELPDREGRLAVFRDAMEMPLHCLHGDEIDSRGEWRNPAPYHLISAAINLAGSRDLTRRDRKSGYWLFSKLYCGSTHTGFRPTRYYRDGDTKLASAIAISGAAASSGMGRDTFFAQAFATVLFNVRLGCWMENPMHERSRIARERGVFWPEYLLREMTMDTTESARFVNISDGGHTGDNVGIYPLLQRRCKIIIALDAECDPELAFGSFTEALRHAYVDLGVEVDIDLSMIRPDATSKRSRSHCAVGRVRYPDRPDQESYLIYMKSSITGDEPEPVLNYEKENPAFPHEKTADQFFDDAQFESYRALGVHVAEDTFGRWVGSDLFETARWYHQHDVAESVASTVVSPLTHERGAPHGSKA